MGGRAIERGPRVLAALALGWTVGLAGCGSGGGSTGGAVVPPPPPPADKTAPTIGEASVAPAAVSFTGGRVTVSANVTDATRVTRVWAELATAGGATQTLDMAATAAPGYAAAWTCPANTEVGAPNRVYTVRVRARDAAGNTGTGNPLTLTVQGVEAPPPMPL